MKNAFAWLGVLLALLLPLQGAIAAAMGCPHEVATNAEPEWRDETHHAAMADDERVCDEMIVVAATQVQHHGHDHPHAGKCGLCAACCMGAALVSETPTSIEIGVTLTETFPVAALPATSVLLEGEERPPRSF